MKLSDAILEYTVYVLAMNEPSTAESYRLRLERFADYCGSRKPDKQLISAWFVHLLGTEKLSKRTVVLYRQTLKQFFTWLVEERDYKVNPVGKLKRMQFSKVEKQIFTADERPRMLEQADKDAKGYWRYGIIAGWSTGLRLSDIALLEWEEIQFSREALKLIPQKTKRFGKIVEIPLMPELYTILAQAKLANGSDRYVCPAMATQYLYDRHKSLSVQFSRLIAKAGIDGKSFHSLRHTFVSIMLERGVPPAVISTITGQTVQQVMGYAHISLEYKREAMGIDSPRKQASL